MSCYTAFYLHGDTLSAAIPSSPPSSTHPPFLLPPLLFPCIAHPAITFSSRLPLPYSLSQPPPCTHPSCLQSDRELACPCCLGTSWPGSGERLVGTQKGHVLVPSPELPLQGKSYSTPEQTAANQLLKTGLFLGARNRC